MRWRDALLAAGLAASLGAACSGPAAGEAPEAGRAAAATFLDHLRAGQVEPAWQGSTVEFKSLMGLDSLRDLVRAHPALKSPAEFVSSRTVAADGLEAAEYTFRATPPAPKGRSKNPPTPATVKVLVSADGGDWRVERLSVE